MSIIRVKTKGQVTIPASLRARLGVAEGDLLEARIEGHLITLTPKTLVDKRLAEGLADIRAGRIKRPFASADALVASLSRKKTSKRAKKTAPRRK
jgi:AbrB family looped-hinge helix DNA binding protein